VGLKPDGDTAHQVVGRFDGLLLTGGHDVDPVLFGQLPHPTFTPSEPGRDAYEMRLLREAARADLPVLAICRGMQVLNVAHGGSLVQDIPDLLPAAHSHWLRAHEVAVTDGSLLQRLLVAGGCAADRMQVNSRHHQAIGQLGHGLATGATTDDGVIEAIEMPSAGFCLGVQWHPEESSATPVSAALFEAFIGAALAWRHR
jgi:putative glutamine amidotransferase